MRHRETLILDLFVWLKEFMRSNSAECARHVVRRSGLPFCAQPGGEGVSLRLNDPKSIRKIALHFA